MTYLLDQPRREKMPIYVTFKRLFSPAECDKIIALGGAMRPGSVGGSVSPREDKTLRSSHVCWLQRDARSVWIYDKLAGAAHSCRTEWWPFNLSGLYEPLQLTRYLAAENGHYSAHKDLGAGSTSRRKISLVILLTPRQDFDGGQLDMLGNPKPEVIELDQGTLIAFPSWELHRVRPVTRGIRHSLVTWVHGPPFQ